MKMKFEGISYFFFVVSLVYGEAKVHQSAQALAGLGHIGKSYLICELLL